MSTGGRIMGEPTVTSTTGRGLLAADAALLTAGSFCLLVFAPPLGPLVGVAVTWWLHGRRFDAWAAVALLGGVVVGALTLGAAFALVAGVAALAGPLAGSEFTAPSVLLAGVGAVFAGVALWLDARAVGDLASHRRASVRLDVARLAATAATAVFVAVFGYLQFAYPAGEFGTAVVFMLAAAGVGAVALPVADAIHVRFSANDRSTGQPRGPHPAA
jgi:hypothetical protein